MFQILNPEFIHTCSIAGWDRHLHSFVVTFYLQLLRSSAAVNEIAAEGHTRRDWPPKCFDNHKGRNSDTVSLMRMELTTHYRDARKAAAAESQTKMRTGPVRSKSPSPVRIGQSQHGYAGQASLESAPDRSQSIFGLCSNDRRSR